MIYLYAGLPAPIGTRQVTPRGALSDLTGHAARLSAQQWANEAHVRVVLWRHVEHKWFMISPSPADPMKVPNRTGNHLGYWDRLEYFDPDPNGEHLHDGCHPTA
jgi:hypothetical protein